MKRVTVTHILDGIKHTTTRNIPDPAVAFTDKKLDEAITKLRVIYQQASSDLFSKQADWIEAHKKRVEKYRAQVEAGLLSQKDFEAWMNGQLFQQRAWELKRGQLAREMVNVDEQAMRLVNEGKLEVFAENANYMGFMIDAQTGGAATSFGLYNRESVARLILNDPKMLPMPKIDKAKDYAWYNKIVQNAVVHGILQGEMLEQIAERIAEETGDRAFDAIRRNARTAYTGAQNAGRVEAMRQARDNLGIKVKKRWLAILDDRTRDAHADLDGKTADIDEPFNSILGPIMFPGDPEAKPANVYNCRCTLEEIPAGHAWKMDRRDGETGEIVGDMTYKEWLKMKGGA